MTSPSQLQTAASELDRALNTAARAIETYFNMARAEARASGRDDTAGGMSARQLKQLLQAYVLAKLSPRPTALFDPILQLAGAPEARRYAASHTLPGLPR